METLENALKKGKKDKNFQSLSSQLEYINKEIKRMLHSYGENGVVNLQTRRSFTCRNKWQAELVEELFKDAYKIEAQGEKLPSYLEKELQKLEEAPYRLDYLEELAYKLATFGSFNASVVEKYDYSLFLKQSDVNLDWLEKFEISDEEIRKNALRVCCDKETIPLEGKTYIYTGSFISFTVCEEFVTCLHKMAEYFKVDGIISNGPWGKYVFQHRSSENNKVLSTVKKLASKVQIYALRSNKESPELIPDLKELGIKFVSSIEDQHNLFLNHQFSNISQKDQLHRFRNYSVDKNLFVHTSYVAFEPVLRNNNIRYIVGSGSSSFNVPTSRMWSSAFDASRLNSEKYDNIGGHLLRFDAHGKVYSSGFFYNKKDKSLSCNGMVFPLKGNPYQGKLHILLSDLHTETMDLVAFNGMIQFITKHSSRIKSLCINGDFLDNVLINHHDEDKIKTQIENRERYKTFLHEIANARQILETIVKALGPNKKIRLLFKYGNHELNSIKKVLNKPLIHFLDSLLNIDSLLGLSEMGFEIIEGKAPYYIGDIPVFHGHEMSRPKASSVLGKSVSGHWHRGKIDNDGVMLPTMQDQKKVDYLRYHITDWTTGWGVSVETENGVVEKPELIIVQDGKYFDFEDIKATKEYLKPKSPEKINITYKL